MRHVRLSVHLTNEMHGAQKMRLLNRRYTTYRERGE
jgi:hypothetical protein